METYTCLLKSGIRKTPEFEMKGLAQYAVNVGIRCGHECTYCSTPSLLRMHPFLKVKSLSPFQRGYAIVDPYMPERVQRDARRIQKRGLIQLCTTVDAWSPEAQKYNLGRRCLEAILSEPGWTVRILTKNASVLNDFDLIEKYKDRVVVGMSITSIPEKEDIIKIIEPNASAITERIAVMQEAVRRRLRTYAMFCPLLPGISTEADEINQLFKLAESWGAEEIFMEAVNPRGNGLMLTQQALEKAGYTDKATEIRKIRKRSIWNNYVVRLIKLAQAGMRKYSIIEKLRFLQYANNLTEESVQKLMLDDSGVIWL